MNESLNLQQVKQGIEECIKSAQEILHAANTLKGRESRRVSLSLYMLAAEEIGKAVLLYRTILLDPNDNIVWKKFWDSFYAHKPKLLAGVSDWSGDFFNLESSYIADFFKNDRRFVLELDSNKQFGFYIIFNDTRKLFEKHKFNYISWDLWSNVINQRLCELRELDKIGLFNIENLNILRNAFISSEGLKILQDYKQIKGTLPLKQRYFTKEYQQFFKSNNLNELLKSYQTVIYKYAKSINFYRNVSLLWRPVVFIRSQITTFKLKNKTNYFVPKKKISKKEHPSYKVVQLCQFGAFFLINFLVSFYVTFYTQNCQFVKATMGSWGIFCLFLFYRALLQIISKIRFPWL